MLVSSAYPQRDVDATFPCREAVASRSAASGHDWPPLFEGIDLFKIDSLRDEFVFGTPQLLMRVSRARAAEWPSVCVPGHPASGFASNPPLPRAKPSAGNLFRALDYIQRLFRVDTQLKAVYVE